MARLVWAAHALKDVGRLADFLAKDDPASAEATFLLIEQAVAILATHPMVGRRVSGDMRDLVISRGATGYIALYEFEEAFDRVVVYALRHQGEAGFDD
jgi:plasmid stabilization system protein ParE